MWNCTPTISDKWFLHLLNVTDKEIPFCWKLVESNLNQKHYHHHLQKVTWVQKNTTLYFSMKIFSIFFNFDPFLTDSHRKPTIEWLAGEEGSTHSNTGHESAQTYSVRYLGVCLLQTVQKTSSVTILKQISRNFVCYSYQNQYNCTFVKPSVQFHIFDY